MVADLTKCAVKVLGLIPAFWRISIVNRARVVEVTTAQKMSVFGVILVRIFLALVLNTERYGVSLRI